MNDSLPELMHFILPGGHKVVSYCHVARTVCRRAERIAIHLAEDFPVMEIDIRYLNRLSDYFFVLGRYYSMHYKVDEIRWNP